ncbi:MAG: DegT/DnrJ/EryC1/StrS family aminotransferase [bacterium]|nr:DegT/DnrJ/EryC1/StrS family aminotransferase [bacterium]
MSKLAINGGEKVRTKKFPAYKPIGKEELEHATRVFEDSIFSRFLGCWHEDFYGGPQVQALEKKWAKYFGVKHAISVNSATSALYCAVGAIETEPFDEIIVSPYTMCASATAPLIYNAIPVFADVEPDCFCLDVKSIEEKITDKTRAIIVVDILGQPYNATEINALAKKHNLKVIEDCAQAPYAKLNGKFAGTLGDIGIYSLNYHKHIHCGEGGILVTNNDELANKIRLIRNHAEAVIEAKGDKNLTNMFGFNFRMTEIECAIANEQLDKLENLVIQRRENIKYLEDNLKDLPFLTMPKVRNGAEHAYYQHAFLYNEKIAGIHRNIFVKAVCAELMPIELRETEGIKVSCGYVKPLYLAPMFQNKIAYGSKGFPWNYAEKENNRIYNYSKGICPIVEDLHYNKLIAHEYMRPGMTQEDLDDVIKAFVKVSENIEELK